VDLALVVLLQELLSLAQDGSWPPVSSCNLTLHSLFGLCAP
jgi:hypothetical protein